VGPVTDEPGTAGASGPGRPRVVIAEDSVLLLAGLTKLLGTPGPRSRPPRAKPPAAGAVVLRRDTM